MESSSWLRNLARADFLKSVGLYVTRDRLVVVRLRKNFQSVWLLQEEQRELTASDGRQAISELTGWIPEDVREIALKAEGDSRERALRQAVLSLLPYLNQGRDPLYVCAPEDQSIVLPLVLPQAAESNLDQVLGYELERQLPFRREDVLYDYVASPGGEGKLHVYVFALPKSAIAGLLDVLGSFGISPAGVETPVTALANYLLFCEPELSDPAAVVGGHRHGWQITGIETTKNGWGPQPRLTFSHWIPEADWSRGVGNELLGSLIQSNVKLYGWGDVASLLNGIANPPKMEAELTSLAGRRLRGKQLVDPEALPAVGVALRGLREASFSVNLLGGAKHAEGNSFSLLNTALTGTLALALAVWALSYPLKDELRLRQLQRANQDLEPSVTALRSEEAQLESARKQLAFFAEIDRRKGEVLRVLDELSKAVPANAYLSNLRYRAGVLEVQGSAENASALIPVLEKSPLFENVGFNAPSNRGRDNRETFSLKAELEKAKEPSRKP